MRRRRRALAVDSPGRALSPGRPWPTAPQTTSSGIRLITAVVVSQFYLEVARVFLPDLAMALLWFATGTAVAIATIRIEKFIRKERRPGR